jgi:hypothetical protein
LRSKASPEQKHKTPSKKYLKQKGAGGMAQVVQCLLSKSKALNSNSSTAKERDRERQRERENPCLEKEKFPKPYTNSPLPRCPRSQRSRILPGKTAVTGAQLGQSDAHYQVPTPGKEGCTDSLTHWGAPTAVSVPHPCPLPGHKSLPVSSLPAS